MEVLFELEQIESWLTAWLTEKYPGGNSIESDDLLTDSGLTSVESVEMCYQLSQKIGLDIDPTHIWEYPSIIEFAGYVDSVLAAERTKNTETTAIAETPSLQKIEEVKTSIQADDSVLDKYIPSNRRTKTDEPIAIVGMSGRFPMAEDIAQFWENLIGEKDCISEIPENRWDWQKYYGDPAQEKNKTNIKWGGFIEGIEEFDPLFFGMSPREAELVDPQQRLLMTYVWKAIEDAGYASQSLAGSKTGIFVGTGSEGYSKLIERANLPIEGFSVTGMVPSVGPNRMSYFLDFHGPSEPIETACSSSLVAIHRAREAMICGSCDMAIVGGVNTIVTPDFHISFSKANMLSNDGRCKTFSDKANGYVRSEGVGMLVMKKLSDAQTDGDHIYGLIRGSAENHGGRATSLTAPNPKAQAELLKSAYASAGVDPQSVSYIEAHGTGTNLGDPIEINGLKAAFDDMCANSQVDPQKHHCALGSVKSNIGHLELAAGVAGVIKVLLQLKHNKLVKSLHADNINPYINLKDSPFRILQESEDWKTTSDESGNRLPRVAGVSSFGFGGVNAHVIIEEYLPDQQKYKADATPNEPVMIVLSSKTERQLNIQVEQLLEAIKSHHSDTPLLDIAYTLQVGRNEMTERLALVTTSVADLVVDLEGYLKGELKQGEFYRGKVDKHARLVSMFNNDKELQLSISSWLEKKKYAQLLELWVSGVKIDWSGIYCHRKPQRVILPGYQFAYQKCWVTAQNNVPEADVSHPLLHRNTSTLTRQRFTSSFTGSEVFFTDHNIDGLNVMPGVAYLEWVREALSQSLEQPYSHICLKNIVWASPIALDGSHRTEFHIDCILLEDNDIEFVIYSLAGQADSSRTVHMQGNAYTKTHIEQFEQRDIPFYQAQCQNSVLSAQQCYTAFSDKGFHYGPAFQGLDSIYLGNGLAVAKLQARLDTSGVEYRLNPSILDAALQASVGLILNAKGLNSLSRLEPQIPFAIDELEILQATSPNMWAILSYSQNSSHDNRVSKIDIELCDEQGNLCVRFNAYSSKAFSFSSPKNIVQTAQQVLEFDAQNHTKILSMVSQQELSKETFKSLMMSLHSGR